MGDKLILGFGGCIDYELAWDQSKLERLARDLNIRLDELDPRVLITDLRTLLISILGFIASGGGGERRVESVSALHDLAEGWSYRVALGGTNVRASLALAQMRVSSTLHVVNLNPTFLNLLPEGVEAIASGDHGDDDFPHVIVQYPAGASISLVDGTVRAGHSNRLIYVHDPPNQAMELHPDLPKLLSEASTVLISGFNGMDDAELVRARAQSLRQAMARMPAGGMVHYEDAAFHHDSVRAAVTEAFAGLATSHGMNEDELQGHLGRTVDLLDVEDVVQAVRDLQAADVLIAPSAIIHTKYWALAVGPAAPNLHGALETAIDVASSRFCFGDQITEQTLAKVATFPRRAESIRLAEAVESKIPNSACVPARRLDVSLPTTIGLGDTFVAGLLLAFHLNKLGVSTRA